MSDLNNVSKNLFDMVDKIVSYKLNNITQIESAIVQSVNANGTVNITIPPNETVYHNVQNQSIYDLQPGDNIKIIKENNQLSNMWVIGGFNLKKYRNIQSNNIVTLPDVYVTESGTNKDGWQYRFWSNGEYEAWFATDAWRSGQFAYNPSEPPPGFTYDPQIFEFKKYKANSDDYLWISYAPEASDTNYFYIKCPFGSITNMQCRANAHRDWSWNVTWLNQQDPNTVNFRIFLTNQSESAQERILTRVRLSLYVKGIIEK